MFNFHRRLDLKWGGWTATLTRAQDNASVTYMYNRGVYASPYPVAQMEDGDVLIGGVKLNATSYSNSTHLDMFLHQSPDPTAYLPRSGTYQQMLVLPAHSSLPQYGILGGEEFILEWKLEKVGEQVRVTAYINGVVFQTSALIDIGAPDKHFIIAQYNQTTSSSTAYRIYGRALYETDDPEGRLGNWDVESVPVVPRSGHNVPENAPLTAVTVYESSYADFTLNLAERPENAVFLGVGFEATSRLRRRSIRRSTGSGYMVGFNEVKQYPLPLLDANQTTLTQINSSFYSPRSRAALDGVVFRVGCELQVTPDDAVHG